MLRKALILILAGLFLATVAGFAYERQAAEQDRQRWPPPGRMLTVDGIDMHIDCRGEGSPTVVLEAGLMAGSSSWVLVHDPLAAITRTCAYDRPRMDWSGDGVFDPHVEGVAARVHALLQAAAIAGPKIMVGMSAGGVYVREYVARYPQEVSAVVLVDSSHEQQLSRLPASDGVERMERLMALCDWLQPTGIVRLGRALDPFLEGAAMPADHFERLRARYYQPGSCAAVAAESAVFTGDLARNVEPRPLGNLPLLVISQGKAPPPLSDSSPEATQARAFRVAWDRLQEELTALSSRGRRVIADRSGHVIQFEQPEVVIAGIGKMVGDVRAEAATGKITGHPGS